MGVNRVMSNKVMDKFVLIHMSDDHFFIENQKNKKVIEFKGKYARSESHYLINRLKKYKFLDGNWRNR